MKKTAKIISIILCFAVLLGCAAGIITSAAGETETFTVAIDEANVWFKENMSMCFTIKSTVENGTVPAGVGIATFATADATDALHTTYVKKTQGDIEYYATYGIAAKEINTTFYYAVVDRDGNEISERKAYGLSAYVTDRKDDEGVTADQLALYEAIIAYGNAAEKVIK